MDGYEGEEGGVDIRTDFGRGRCCGRPAWGVYSSRDEGGEVSGNGGGVCVEEVVVVMGEGGADLGRF